jgi:hypothetical protein
LFAPKVEKWVSRNEEPADPPSDERCEGCIEVAFAGCLCDDNLLPDGAGGCLYFCYFEVGPRIGKASVIGVLENPGTTSSNNSRRFGATSTVKELTPVILPPGRLRLATKPSCTGSPALRNTIGMVDVAALTARSAGRLAATMDCNRTADQLRR